MLKGYKVLITGATSGLGLAATREFIDQGATVIGVGRNFENTKDLGEQFIPCKCDVTDPEQIAAVKEFTEKTFGSLDALICNAGASAYGTPENIELTRLDNTYKLHFRHNALFTQALAPLLKKSSNPSISYTSSCGSFGVIDDGFAYGAMKHALNYYTRAAACFYDGIRCNAVCPGLIKTNIFSGDTWDALENDEATMASIPAGRLGDASEVAKLFAFLASEEASYVNGAIIAIDGGYSMTHPRIDILP